MITRDEYLEYHWLPYIMCEEDFLNILEYVALRPSNFSTSSEKLIRSLLTSCELFESLMKQMYAAELSRKLRPNIVDFLREIRKDDIFNGDQRIAIKRGINLGDLRAFAEMDERGIPQWWVAHNLVKHNHSTNFEEGNLYNALNALSALYLSNLVFVKKIGAYWKQKGVTANNAAVDVPNDISHLFDCPDFETRYHIASRDSYFLPNDEFIEHLFPSRFPR